MRFWSEARPSVQVDADKDRLEKKSQPFDSKAQAERGAVAAHQPGPEDPELEGQDRTGNGTDRELNGHHNGPPAAIRRATGSFLRMPMPFISRAYVGSATPRGTMMTW